MAPATPGPKNVTHVTISSRVPRIFKRRLPPPPNPFVAKKRYVSYVPKNQKLTPR